MKIENGKIHKQISQRTGYENPLSCFINLARAFQGFSQFPEFFTLAVALLVRFHFHFPTPTIVFNLV